MRYSELPLAAQTAYAELAEQTRAFELDAAVAGLSGSFHQLARKGRGYWYFAYRDLAGKQRMLYVGPDEPRVRALAERFRAGKEARPLVPQAQAALALGCVGVAPKHFRIIRRLSEHGFFRAGGMLIGTHAFRALGNLLGVRWTEGASTLDVDLAHAGSNISVALPADVEVDVPSALESLEMGLLPITQLDGKPGAQYRNPKDPELRIDFLTSGVRGGRPIVVRNLGVALQPLKFMELSLESPTQACLLGRAGACLVNIPAPERYAVHKLLVYGERPVAQRTKAGKDLLQVAAIADYFARTGQATTFNQVWRDALARGRGWRSRAMTGLRALLMAAPDVDRPELWEAG